MFQVFYRLIIIMVSLMLHGKAICRIHEELNKMRYVTKSGFLIVLNGYLMENVGHALTKNYNGTYWPLNC